MRFRDAASAQGDASQFFPNLNFIAADRVEVLRGSGSSLYGTNAASGVVNIVTDQGGGLTHGNIQAEGGSLGFLHGRSQIGGGAFQDRLKYTAGLIHLNVMRGLDANDRARNTGGQAFLNYDLTPRTAVSARFFGSDDFMQLNVFPTAAGIPAANIPGAVIVRAAALSNYFPGRDDPDYRRSSRFHSTAFKIQQILSGSSSFQASYQKVHTSRVYINGPAGPGFQPVVPDYSRYAGDIDTIDVRSNTRLSPWNLLTAGYEFEREHYADVVDNNLPASRRVQTETGIRQNASALYFQNQSGFLRKRLQLSVSGRAQFFRLDRPEFQARGASNGYGGIKLVSPPKAMTGDVSLSWFTEVSGTKFRAHLGNAYRAPSLFERFGAGFFNDPSTDKLVFTPYGDPFLAPDRYNSGDGGIDQYFWHDRIRVSGTYFYSRVVSITAFDLGTVIKSSTDPFGRSFGYINGSGGMSRGVELSVKAQPGSNFAVTGSYTYTNAVMDRDITVPGFRRVLGIPRHIVTLVATRQIGRRAAIATDLTGSSEMFGNFTAAGRPRAYRYPGIVKMDVSGSWALKESDRGDIKINARVENILNRRYYDLGWRMPGAAFVAGLGFQF
jgi:iron complex outermembrane receptor protein